MAPKIHALKVVAIEKLTADSVALSFAVPPELADDYLFVPGQYLTLRAMIDGQDVRRPYSISSPIGAAALTVAVRLVPGGQFSSYANKVLQVGDAIPVMTPQGRFVANGAPKTVLLLAAGSGITPMMSIAISTLEANADGAVTLVYGNRKTDSIMFQRALEILKDRFMERLTVIHLLSREEQDVPLLNGRLDGEKLAALTRVGAVDPLGADGVFLCGPGEMTEDLRRELGQQGVADSKVRSEKFIPAEGSVVKARPSEVAHKVAASGAFVEVILDGTRKQIPLQNAEDTILEAARRHGMDLPFSCKGGMCCTCRCKIARGSAEMAVNYSLEKWETDAGFTLACQARATSDDLVLDFDAT